MRTDFYLKHMLAAGMVSLCVLMNANVGQAHYISSAQEKMIGAEAARQYEAQHNAVWDQHIIDLEAKLIKANPGKLTSNTGNNRYLEAVKVVADDQSENAYTFPGGYIYMTQGTMDRATKKILSGGDRYNYDCNDIEGIYRASYFSGVMAHEIGHWYNEDYLRQVDRRENLNMLFAVFGQQGNASAQLLSQLAQRAIYDVSDRGMSLQVEKEADSTGLEFIDNTNDLSTGGMASVFTNYIADEAAHGYHDPTHGSNAHSNNDVRLKRIFEYWKKISNGMITFACEDRGQNGICFKMAYGGQAISSDPSGYGMLSGRGDTSGQDKTYYFAGQLAKAISKGYVSPTNNRLYIVSDEYAAAYFGMKYRPDGLILVAFSPDKKDMILLSRLEDLQYHQIRKVRSNFASLPRSEQEEYNEYKYISTHTGLEIGFLMPTKDSPQ